MNSCRSRSPASRWNFCHRSRQKHSRRRTGFPNLQDTSDASQRPATGSTCCQVPRKRFRSTDLPCLRKERNYPPRSRSKDRLDERTHHRSIDRLRRTGMESHCGCSTALEHQPYPPRALEARRHRPPPTVLEIRRCPPRALARSCTRRSWPQDTNDSSPPAATDSTCCPVQRKRFHNTDLPCLDKGRSCPP